MEYLSWVGIPYGELVRDHRIELVVTELSVRYRQPARLGDRLDVSVLLDLERAKGVRIPLHSALTRDDGAVLATADVTLAPINADSGRLLRRLPPRVRTAIFEPYEGDADSPLEEDMVRSSPAMNSI